MELVQSPVGHRTRRYWWSSDTPAQRPPGVCFAIRPWGVQPGSFGPQPAAGRQPLPPASRLEVLPLKPAGWLHRLLRGPFLKRLQNEPRRRSPVIRCPRPAHSDPAVTSVVASVQKPAARDGHGSCHRAAPTGSDARVQQAANFTPSEKPSASPSARKVDASPSRPLSPAWGLMEQFNAPLQRGSQG
jgi:hypothetical protein